MSIVSINAAAIRKSGKAEALACVDEVLGNAAEWAPSLIDYRLTSPFQGYWKLEVGGWLLLARELGFLPALLNRLQRAFKEAHDPKVKGANDSAHRILQQELAPAMAVHYFTVV